MENLNLITQEILNKSTICGISSDEVNLAKNLVDNKSKDDSLFICEGLWACDKLISQKFVITHFFYNIDKIKTGNETKDNLEKAQKLVSYANQSFGISEKACKKISDREGFDEYFIIVKAKKFTFADVEKMIANNNNVMAIVMDGLEQPGNIGAILRSFDSAGGNFAFITNRKARLTNSRLIRSSLGASFMVPTIDCEINELQNWFVKNNFKCIVTDLTATQSFKEVDYSGRIAIVAGNEHTGISPSWRSVKNAQRIIIPMLGSVESLNVGFASTLVAYEAGLQKFNKKQQ